MEKDLAQQTLALVQKDLQLPTSKEDLDEEQAIDWLSKAIRQLLNQDFERFLQICYRIDLSEAKLKKILHESEPDELAMDLANAIWERQKQKIEIRRRYS
ncbi:hypothetical protein ACFOSV_02770 [Algoriphagus namhaensis]|uniref:Uncharacterized protein n=1 Tax=Algoriphagus namhaensis TaxID=915353 RepID=A0ABV8AME4_9BACT